MPQDPNSESAKTLLKNNHGRNMEFNKDGLPEGWLQTSLLTISKINPKPEKNSIDDNLEVSFVPMKCVKELSGEIDLSITKPYYEVKTGYTFFEDNDIVFAKITPCMENGKIAVIEGAKNGIGLGSTEFHVIRLHSSIPREFYFYYLIQDEFRKKAQSKMKGTAGQLRVPTNFLQQELVPVPPLPEQHRIVAKIESIFAQIDAIRENLEMLALQTSSASRSLRQFKNSVLKQAFEGKLVPQDPKDEPAEAVLNRLHKDFAKNMEVEKKNLPLGWVKIPLAKIATINPKKPSLNTIGGDLEITFVPMKCVKELTGEVDLSTTRKYAEIRNGYTYFQNNDIIFAKITPCMENGKIAIMQNLKNKIGFGSTEFHVIRLIDNLGVRKFYFYYFIQDVFRNTAQHHMKGTAGQLRIPTHYLENVVVPFPPPTEQHRIVTKIESIFSKIDAINKNTKSALESLDVLKQSTLRQAFQGRLVPQDPNDEPADVLPQRIKAQKSQEMMLNVE